MEGALRPTRQDPTLVVHPTNREPGCPIEDFWRCLDEHFLVEDFVSPAVNKRTFNAYRPISKIVELAQGAEQYPAPRFRGEGGRGVRGKGGRKG